MKSGLQPSQLAKIWALCDSSKAGELLFPEFALAMHLVNDVLQGDSIPYELDTKTKNEVSSFIDAINLSIASQSYTDLSQARTPFDQLVNQGTTGLQAQNTGFMPQTSFGMPLQTQITGRPVNNAQDNFAVPLQSQITGGAVSNAQNSFGVPLQSQITGGGLPATPNSFGMPLQSQVTGGGLKSQNTGYMPQTSFGLPVQPQVGPAEPTAHREQTTIPEYRFYASDVIFAKSSYRQWYAATTNYRWIRAKLAEPKYWGLQLVCTAKYCWGQYRSELTNFDEWGDTATPVHRWTHWYSAFWEHVPATDNWRASWYITTSTAAAAAAASWPFSRKLDNPVHGQFNSSASYWTSYWSTAIRWLSKSALQRICSRRAFAINW